MIFLWWWLLEIKNNCSRTEVNCTNLWAEISGCESGIYCRWILIRQELLGGSCVTSGDVAEISTSPSAACLLILKLMEKDDLEFPNSGQTDPCACPGVGLDDPFGPFWLWIICDSVKADLQWGFLKHPLSTPTLCPSCCHHKKHWRWENACMVLQTQTLFAITLYFLLSGEVLSQNHLNYLRLNPVFFTLSQSFL